MKCFRNAKTDRAYVMNTIYHLQPSPSNFLFHSLFTMKLELICISPLN